MAGVSDIAPKDRPLSEEYRIAGLAWSRADEEYTRLSENKNAHLAALASKLIAIDPKMSEAKAERLVRASPEWAKYCEAIAKARGKSTAMFIERNTAEMRFNEWRSRNARARHEYDMGAGHGQ